MKNILDQLADHARERVAAAKAAVSADAMRAAADSLEPGHFEFERALKKPGLSFICECKKASPSKGLIAPDFPYLEIAEDYERAGADAISCLTEPKWFLGKDAYLQAITNQVRIPVLRKDFTVDTGNSAALRDLVPPEVVFISESGVKTPADVQAIRATGADAVLVGEALMRAEDKTAALKALKSEA